MLRISKPVGITPIDFWLDYRIKHFLPDNSRIESQRLPIAAICGKLDPMAEGELVIILKQVWSKHLLTPSVQVLPLPIQLNSLNFSDSMDALCNHEKTYKFTLLIGVSTNSDDRLGIIEAIFNPSHTHTHTQDMCVKIVEKELLEYCANLKEQEYHAFSAKRVNGKPLWWWKRHDRMNEISVPKHLCNIKEVEIINNDSIISTTEFVKDTVSILTNNKENLEDFIVDNIINSWTNLINLSEETPHNLSLVTVRVRVTGGTFIRQICRDLIKKTGIPMMCSSIIRECIHI